MFPLLSAELFYPQELLPLYFIPTIQPMYSGKAALLKQRKQQQQKARRGKDLLSQKSLRLKSIFSQFQQSIGTFTEKYRTQINTNPKFRDKFNSMCQELGVDPMQSKKNMWTELGFGDFYHYLAMKILDICAKRRHQNGGLMRIDNVIQEYNRLFKDSISRCMCQKFRNDIVRALDKTAMLGNLSIVNQEYVCTVPLEMNEGLPQLMEIAEKYGFVSGKLLKKVKGWESQDFYMRIEGLRKSGLLWVDKKTKGEPQFYFATHVLDFEVGKFLDYINEY